MKENYCLGDDGSNLCNLRRQRKSAKSARKNLNLVAVLLLVVLVLTAGTCWWSDQALTQARAMQGDADSEYTLGKRCLDRAQTPQELAKAVGLVRKAAEQGNPKAQTGLGILYLKGLGVP